MVADFFSVVTLVAATLAPEQSTDAAMQALRLATGRALQGNVAGAVALLEQARESEFDERDLATRQCIIERFSSHGASEDRQDHSSSITAQARRLYRSYWRASLLRPETKATQEQQLVAGLRSLLGLSADQEWNAIEQELRHRVAREGKHVLMGRTPPLLEFITWSSETSEVRQVPLPGGRYSIKVKILDDFASLGWSAYATCDRSFTGGWVKDDAVYAVRPGWKDLTAENFRVSFLAHETQHFADRERFGKLESWELEYRAKLAELALADKTLPSILSAFNSNQASDPSLPHSFANRIVLSWIANQLGVDRSASLAATPPTAIRKAAKALLARDSSFRSRH